LPVGRHAAALRALALLASVALLGACGPERAPVADVPAAAPGPPIVGPGELSLRVEDGRVHLAAVAVWREDVVRRLSESAGFEVLGEVPESTVTLSLADAGVADVLGHLLFDVEHELRVAPDPDARRARVVRVRIGPFHVEDGRAIARAPEAEPRDTTPLDARTDPGAEPTQREWQPPFEPAAVFQGMRLYADDQVYAGLAHGDPTVRAWAVAHLRPEGDDLAELTRLVAEDADPAVRVASAEQLALSDSAIGIASLLGALEDPDPAVVLAAIDALEFSGDALLVPELEPLLLHSDDRVRHAVREAITLLD
jgi:hypothetical protein